MLLRQALEQIRAGMPTPVLFNSSIAVLHHTDEVSTMVQKDFFDIHFHSVQNRVRSSSFGSSGQLRQAQPYRQAASLVTGAQAS
jgi:hypothetical protein